VNARLPNQTTPLHVAACLDCVDVIRELLAHGVQVDARDEDGHTPLHEAAGLSRSPDAVALLIKAGANVNAETDDGRRPIDRTSGFQKLENAKLLLNAGARTSGMHRGWRTIVLRSMSTDGPDHGRS
jgi:cytohesin